MSFLGEIKMFAGAGPISGWRPCDGTPVDIAAYPDLYNLIGPMLPDIRSRVMVHSSSDLITEARGGVEQVGLVPQNLPAHSHAMGVTASAATTGDPTGNVLGDNFNSFTAVDPANASLAAEAMSEEGGGQPHPNIQPYVVLNFYICITGGELPAP